MADFPRKRAILIGVDAYERLTPLRYSGRDVTQIASSLTSSLKFREEDILQFTATSNLKPNRSAIIDNLGRFVAQKVDPDELLLFYFSGHGVIDHGDGKDYLLPIDASPFAFAATGLSVDYVVERLCSTKCRNVVMFIDACREAVAGAKGAASIGASSREMLEREGVVTFFACDPQEKSYEIDDIQHGSFSYCLLDVISNGTCTTVGAVDRHLSQAVPELNSRYHKPLQRPFTVIKPAEKSELTIFYSTAKERVVVGNLVRLMDRLGERLVNGDLDEKIFNDAIETITRASVAPVLDPLDVKRMRFIEAFCNGTLSATAFRVAWQALDRWKSAEL